MAEEVRFHCALGDDELLFRRMSGIDALGRLPEWRVELLRLHSKKAPVKPEALLGKGAGVTLVVDNTHERHFHGLVTEFQRGGVAGRADIYRVVLRPWLWQLTLGADCRIFQDKTVIQILDDIFGKYQATSLVKKRLGSATYASRPYTVQYRESDFDFVTRLMEEEGLYYYFTSEKSQHTMVLCNGPSGHDPLQGGQLEWSAPLGRNHQREDIVLEWSRAHVLRPLRYGHTDFAAEAPTTDLKASAERSAPYTKPNALEWFDFPGGQDDHAMGTNTGSKAQAGKDSAQLEVDRWESEHSVATGLSPFRAIATGQSFNLKSHPDADGYLLTSTIIELSYTGNETNSEERRCDYLARFNAVPKSVRFMPLRSVERPSIAGPQTATVVGPSGDEIHTDKYGRVKLQFHWDRVGQKNEKSSCWVRVSHPWASKTFGMVALPRVGDEVVVDFLEGNPDRPLVTGRVYNGDNMPPYELPAQATVTGLKSRSSKGGGAGNANELRFDDKKGSEYVWFQAEKDLHRLVKNDERASIGHDLAVDIGNNADHTVGASLGLKVGKQAIVDVGADTHLKVGSDLNAEVAAALGVKVGSGIDVKGGTAIAVTAGTGIEVKAGTGLNATAATAINVKGLQVVVNADVEISLKVGGSFVTIGPAGVFISGPMVYVNSGGAGGAATAATAANPPAPKAPPDLKENKDPLAG